MTAINHALTGTAIGLIVQKPALAIPLAILSHYICDIIPHFGPGKTNPNKTLKSNLFRNYLVVEAGLCFLLVVGLAIFQPHYWLLAAICAFAAAAPDLLSINRYLSLRAGRSWHPGLYVRFASAIQWFERPIGSVVEVAWFVAVLLLIVPIIR